MPSEERDNVDMQIERKASTEGHGDVSQHSVIVLCEPVQITSYKLHSFQFPFANSILGELVLHSGFVFIFFPDPFILAHAIGILQLCICSDC